MFRLSKRLYSSQSIQNFYKVFPKTFPGETTPFAVNLRDLKKEYRALQTQHHPDLSTTTDDSHSSLLNKAYTTLKNPLTRSQHLLLLKKGLDLNKDDMGLQDKSILFDVYEIFETLEDATTQEEIDQVKKENDAKLKDTEKKLELLYAQDDLEEAIKETIKLKYLKNIEQAIKTWEVGKPVTLSH